MKKKATFIEKNKKWNGRSFPIKNEKLNKNKT
jgi:hypothetical protein